MNPFPDIRNAKIGTEGPIFLTPQSLGQYIVSQLVLATRNEITANRNM
jgi:hypothetical protein